MAKKNKKVEEESAQSVGEWIVTFSDCMTLLLCFFVLLLTFSSFDEEVLQRFGGAFEQDRATSMMMDRRRNEDTLVKPEVHIRDLSQEGSETPTEQALKDLTPKDRPPESLWIADTDAFCDRKIVHIDSARLFTAGGFMLTADGRSVLDKIAGFLDKLPCRVVISESYGRYDGSGKAYWRRVGMNRAWAVMAYFTNVRGLSSKQFNVSSSHQAPPGPRSSGQVVEVVMLAGKMYQ